MRTSVLTIHPQSNEDFSPHDSPLLSSRLFVNQVEEAVDKIGLQPQTVGLGMPRYHHPTIALGLQYIYTVLRLISAYLPRYIHSLRYCLNKNFVEQIDTIAPIL